MAGLNCTGCGGELVIEGFEMNTAAWCLVDLVPLWFNTETRGSNVLIPGASGQRAYPIRVDETRHSLPMIITGEVNEFCVLYNDPMIGLETNLALIVAAVVNPPAAPTATQTATLTLPSGATRTAEIQVNGLTPGEHVGPLLKATFDITIPLGKFS